MADVSVCEILGCCNPLRARGMCASHYAKWSRHGNPLHPTVKPADGCSIPECVKKHHANGYCISHNDQWRRYGDPLKRYRSVRGEKIKWLKAHKNYKGKSCLIFPFPLYRNGYSIVSIDGTAHRAAHAMLRISKGPPPSNAHECAHSCGNGNIGCVNPRHLRWATSAENTNDQRKHGTLVKGERHGMSKLTRHDVLAIRALKGKMKQHEIADRFGISGPHVSGILSGKEWSWL